MANLLFYFSGLKSLTPDLLDQHGLNDVVGPHGFTTREVDAGPDASPGLVVGPPVEVDGAAPAALGYWPENQVWEQAGGRSYWVGRENAGAVRPLDLQRARLLEGHPVELADRQTWIIPTALRWDGTATLPRTLKLGPEGKLIAQVMPAWLPTLEEAIRVHGHLFSELAGETPAEAMTTDEGYRIACDLLRINYRLGPAEVGVLGLLTDQNLTEVLQAFVDVPSLLAVAAARAQKKTDHASIPDGSGICCGGGG